MSNYDIHVNMAKQLFLKENQPNIIRRLGLESDTEYIYVRFLSVPYRICRASGDITSVTDHSPAGFHVHMTVFDALCRTEPPARLDGRKLPVNSLGGGIHPGVGESLLLNRYADIFSAAPEKLTKACESLNGKPFPIGDIAYEIPLFDFLPVVIQLWLGDDEFPARLALLWDENTLQHLRYETVWYAASEVLDTISKYFDE